MAARLKKARCKAQESAVRHQVYAVAISMAQIREVADCHIVDRRTALSPPAFEQCPRSVGARRQATFRPPIGVHMKNPSNRRRSTSLHDIARALAPGDRRRKARRRVGLSGWKALEHEQFRALIAAPRLHARSKVGSRSW
jgi:hypothetical protein